MKQAAALVAIAAVCLFLAGEAMIPRAVGTRLERAIVSGVEQVESVRVRVRTFPAVELALGRIDSLQVDVRNVVVDGLRVQRLFLDASRTEIDLGSTFRGGGFGIRRIGRGDVTVMLSEEDLNSYFRSRDGVLRLLTVKLRRDVAVVSGTVNVLGARLDVALEGRFVVVGDTRLTYVVDRITVGRAVVPEVIRDGLVRSLDLCVDVSGLPVPVMLTEVSVQDRVVYIFGTASVAES